MRFFREHANSPILRYRIVCAYNVPAVLKTIGAKKYMNQLHSIYSSMAHDPHIQVREKIASSIHEIAKLLTGDKSIEHIKPIFLYLMKDSQVTIRNKALSNISEILRSFQGADSRSENDFFSQLVACLVKHSYTIGRDWRTQEVFYSNFKCFDEFFSSEELQSSFLPLLKTQIVRGVVPVKVKAIESFVSCTRSLKNYSTQIELFKTMNNLLARDKSYWNRTTFLDLSFSIMKYFSRQFFKDNFYVDVMNLAKDPVPNVRRKFCFLLPHIKLVLELPADVQLLADIKETISFLTLDKDRDVSEAAKYAHEEITTIDNEIMRGHKLNLLSRADLFDKQKQKEEEDWGALDRYATQPEKPPTRKKSDPSLLSKGISPPSTANRPTLRSTQRSKSQTRILVPNETKSSISNVPGTAGSRRTPGPTIDKKIKK